MLLYSSNFASIYIYIAGGMRWKHLNITAASWLIRLNMETKKIKVDDIADEMLAPKRAAGGRASDYIVILDKVLKGEVLEISGLPYFRRNRFLRFTRGKNSDPKYAGKVLVLDTITKTDGFPQYQNKNSYKVVLILKKDYDALKKARDAGKKN